MFIVGFLFPWCWLIGGWLLPFTASNNSGPVCAPSVERLRPLLPVSSVDAQGGVVSGRRSYAMTAQSRSNTSSGSTSRARWGRRCRIAAGVGAVVVAAVSAVAIWFAIAR
jgi:hypothetical protein